MATYLLDTNIIIDAINNKRGRSRSLRSLAERGHTLACCPINVAEVYAGLRPKEEQATAALLRSFELYPITFPVAELAGRLKREYGGKGTTLTIADTIVAAVALYHQITLITDNAKDFPMEDLSVLSLPKTDYLQ
jgi:predicted nucleic acid-binding protein